MTNSPIADASDTLLTWASTTEAELATRLASVEYFVDVDYSGDELERFTRFYGTFLGRQIAAGAQESALLSVCPALTATTLLGRAARLNEVQELAREYWAGLELDPTPDRVALIEGRFAAILSAAGLDPMDGSASGPDGELGRLFAHVGLASDWIPELVELIDRRRMAAEGAGGPEADPAAEGPGDEVEGQCEAALEDLDAEAAAIVAELAAEQLQAGPLCATLPNRARSLIAPIVRIVRHAARHPHSWEHTLPNPEELGLPTLIREDVIEELRERPAGVLNRRHNVGVAHREDQPRICLDAVRNRVVLRLPAQHLASYPGAEVRWRVDADGRAEAYRTGRMDRPGGAEGPAAGASAQDPALAELEELFGLSELSEILDIPVRQPVRDISVRNTSDDQHWTLPLVDASDPLLIFSTRGMDLSSLACIHRSAVWVVCPEDATAVDPVQDQLIPVTEQRPCKSWEGWVLRRLDLSDALALHVERPGERRPFLGTVRAVDPRQRVRFIEPDSPVWGIRTATGKPIFASGLHVEFPPTISGDVETWYLSVSAYAGPGQCGEEVSEEAPLEVPAEGGLFDVFDTESYDSPWVGEYLVRLRGPRGESFRHEHALVEGLQVEAVVEGPAARTRLPLTGGLSPVSVRLRPAGKPFEATDPVLVPADQRTAGAVIETAEGDALPVVVDPPRVRYQLPLTGEDPMWRTEAAPVVASWIDVAARFRVRPGVPIEAPRLVIRNHHGAPVRTLVLTTLDHVTWWVDLAAVAPSLPTLGRGTCELEFVDAAAGKRVSVRIARIVPSFHVEVCAQESEEEDAAEGVAEVAAAPQTLLLTADAGEDAEAVLQWAAWVWPLSAPWERARSVTLQAAAGGTALSLPPELVGAGPLAIQLYAPDRFSDLRPPIGPGPRALTVAAPGYFGAGTSTPWADLAAFLAGEREDVPTDPEILPTLWDVQAGWLRRRVSATPSLKAHIRAALTHQPRESVHAMSQSLVPAADRPAQFIASGLVHSSFAAPHRTGERPSAAWIAALEIMGEWSRVGEGDPALAKALRQELAAVAGPGLSQTLDTGRDATLETACIDSTTVQIAHMDPAQQQAVLEMFFGGAGLVPGALSDEGSRLIAVFDTFTRRAELSALLGDEALITTAVSVLRRVKSANRQLYLSARVRFDRLEGVNTDDPANRWALAPVISLVFALATRMHAHGHLESLGKLPIAYDGWAALAREVPDLVTGDIVAADAMVLGVYGPSVE